MISMHRTSTTRIRFLFNWTSSTDTKQFRNWIAATTNNSVYEFQEYCAANRLPSPPGNLKMLVTPWGGDGNTGSAPIFDKMSAAANQVIVAVPAAAILMGVFGVAFPPVALLGIALGEWIAAAAPDIVLNVNEAANVNADDMREILYNKLAQSIHFPKVGEGYWLAQIAFVINNVVIENNPPYGNATTPGSGRCAVIEAWGFQNGMWATHGRYGAFHTNPGIPASSNTWHSVVERRTFTSGYIAFGWQHDWF